MKITVTCSICGTVFEGYIRKFPPKYCSNECRYKGQLIRQRQWKQKSRQRKRMKWLKENQQFREDMPIMLDKECWICGSNEDLLLHHVKYYPKVVKKTLCRSCHEFLHKGLLRRKKCTPRHSK